MKQICLALVLVGTWILFTFCSFSQGTNIQKPIQYTLKSDFFLSTSSLPFWHYANQYNLTPKQQHFTSITQIYLNIDYQKDSLKKHTHLLGWGSEVNGIVQKSLSNKLKIVFPDFFLKLRLGSLEFWGGRRREIYGFVGDTTLTSGSFSWSSNAFPIPKIQINTLGFIDVPFTNSLLQIHATFAHGWLDTLAVDYGARVNTVKGYLHQKTLYIKIGRPSWRVNLYGGFNHQAQWGGENQIWPDGLPPKEAWWAVVIGKPWQGSRVGNHLGTLDLGMIWKLSDDKSLTFFRQNIFDDGSLYNFLNIKDGLQGVTFRNRSTPDYTRTFTLEKINLEWLNTTSQGGDVFDFQQQIFGRDNYFNHYVYPQGWSYKNEMIGTPFIPKQSDILNPLPTVKNLMTINNRVQVVHLGTSGWIDEWKWLIKASFSSNLGTYDYPFPTPLKQFSGLLQIQKELPLLQGIDWTTSIAFDSGLLYEPSLGIHLGLRKRGFF